MAAEKFWQRRETLEPTAAITAAEKFWQPRETLEPTAVIRKVRFLLMRKILLLAVLIFMIAGKTYAASVETLLAESETARKTDQIILVVDHSLSLWNKVDGVWQKDLESRCNYGKNGLNLNRHAGDKTTPIGAFPILYAFGMDANPGTEMTYKKITPNSYLSAEDETYNTWVESASYVAGEHLIEYFPEYKYAMNFGFNLNPTELGRGAAIFLHCNSTYKDWTSGCVSVPENVMLELLLKSHDGEWIIIVPKAADIANY